MHVCTCMALTCCCWAFLKLVQDIDLKPTLEILFLNESIVLLTWWNYVLMKWIELKRLEELPTYSSFRKYSTCYGAEKIVDIRTWCRIRFVGTDVTVKSVFLVWVVESLLNVLLSKQHRTVRVDTNSTCGWKVSHWTNRANTSSATDFRDRTLRQLIVPVKDPLTANVQTSSPNGTQLYSCIFFSYIYITHSLSISLFLSLSLSLSFPIFLSSFSCSCSFLLASRRLLLKFGLLSLSRVYSSLLFQNFKVAAKESLASCLHHLSIVKR